MSSFLKSLLTFATLGMISLGCQRSEGPMPSTDVTLLVPAMN